jgi:retinol dehydrogenase-12/retinol dehydrogenase-13
MGDTASKELGKGSTGEEVLQKVGSVRVEDKHVLITGGTSGLGFESARVLLNAGARVTITSRTEAQGLKAVERLEGLTGKKAVHEVLDLGDLTSVKSCASRLLAKNEPIHVLMNNAGLMACPLGTTVQGHEMQLGVNHIGHFLLTKLLLPLLALAGTEQVKARVVNLSSMGAYLYAPPQGLFWDDLSGDKEYNKWTRYGQSKLANCLFSHELNKVCAKKKLPVESFVLHPGAILETDLMRHNSLLPVLGENLYLNWNSPDRLGHIFLGTMKTVQQGAATQVYCSAAPGLEPAGWYVDCKEVGAYVRHPLAADDTTSERLWVLSEEIVKDFV